MSEQRYCGYLDNAKGEPGCPLSSADFASKFLTLSKIILKTAQSRSVM